MEKRVRSSVNASFYNVNVKNKSSVLTYDEFNKEYSLKTGLS